ncbi:MAG: LysM peptidoglycan-binding domain-containing protein [Chitinophagales bacterium]
MGLFSFVKNAGAKVFGKKEKTETVSQADLDAQKAKELERKVKGLGLSIQDLSIEVDGETAIVYGQSDRLDYKEKAILAVGNVEGIASVDDRIVWLRPATESIGLTDDFSDDIQPSVEAVEVTADRSITTDETDAADYAVSQFHTVEKGDSLSKISKTYYGTFSKYMVIFEANEPMLKSPDAIYPGQVLRIPPLT